MGTGKQFDARLQNRVCLTMMLDAGLEVLWPSGDISTYAGPSGACLCSTLPVRVQLTLSGDYSIETQPAAGGPARVTLRRTGMLTELTARVEPFTPPEAAQRSLRAHLLGAQPGPAAEPFLAVIAAFQEQIYEAWPRALAEQFETALAAVPLYGVLAIGSLAQVTEEGGMVLADGSVAHLPQPLRTAVYLPVVERVRWRRRWEALTREPVVAEGGALWAPAAQDNRWFAASLLASQIRWVRRHAGPPLSFTYDDKISGAQAQSVVSGVLSGSPLGRAARNWLQEQSAPDEPVHLRLTFSLPADARAAWLDFPPERAKGTVQIYQQMSLAVQAALRRWLPLLTLRQPEDYAQLPFAHTVLGYASTTPFVGRSRAYLCYDGDDRPSLERAWASASRRFGGMLARTYELLAAWGVPCRRAYDPHHRESSWRTVKKDRKMLSYLFLLDSLFIDDLIRLVEATRRIRMQECRLPQTALNIAMRAASRFGVLFQRRLTRICREPGNRLATLLLLEVTQALARARGCEIPRNISLRLETAGRGVTFAGDSGSVLDLSQQSHDLESRLGLLPEAQGIVSGGQLPYKACQF